MDFIERYITRKILNGTLNQVKRLITESKEPLKVSNSNFENSINHHLIGVLNWAKEISFKDLQGFKPLKKSFVELELYLSQVRYNMDNEEGKERRKIISTLKRCQNHVAILGKPGAGKTTSMKYVAYKLLTDEKFFKDKLNFPIVIRLREITSLNPFNSIIFEIYNILGIIIEVRKKITPEKIYIVGESIPEIKKEKTENITKNFYTYEKLIEKVVMQVLDDLKVLIILDGLDEVKKDLRENIVFEVQKLTLRLNKAKVILTSRTGDFTYKIQNSSEFEICPLDEKQIELFARKWLGKKDSELFIKKIEDSPFLDTTIKPLTIAHLCAIFEREKKLPQKPKTVYRKVINLLLEEWDLQKPKVVVRQSKYSNFEADRKFEFLCNMAFELTARYHKIIFTKEQFQNVYVSICNNFGLPKYEINKVGNEIETATGLFIQSGYEKFEFAHKSLQEFLAAEYITKLPFLPIEELKNMPNEAAISIAISSNPSEFFMLFVLRFFKKENLHINYLNTFIDRIISERVDFIINPRLGIALLHLTTKYLKKGFSFEELKSIKLLYEITNVRLSIYALKDYCQINKKKTALKDNYVVIETKNIPSKEIRGIKISKRLYAFEEFVVGW